MLTARGIALLALIAAVGPACARRAEPPPPIVPPAPMPPGADWQGVYTSGTHGDLHLRITDERADGAWRTPDGVYGKLWGAVQGDQIRYAWSERRRNDRGYRIPWFGRGYFVYRASDTSAPDRITGEFGLDWAEMGERWAAVKIPGVEPDLVAVRAGLGDDGDDDEDESGDFCATGCDGEEEY
jgi:hypothetical protein